MPSYRVTRPQLTISAIDIGSILLDFADVYRLPASHPEAKRQAGPIYCFHLSLPGRSLLVDAGVHDFPEEMTAPGNPPPGLLEQLAQGHVGAEDIAEVVITHRHFDHINGLTQLQRGEYLPTFPNARHYLGEADWQPADASELERRTLGVLWERGLLTLVAGERDLGDGLSLLPAPGETPGHQLLRLEASGEVFYFAGDLYHHPLEFVEEERNVNWADAAAMTASKRDFSERALVEKAGVFFAHLHGMHRLVATPTGVRWQASNE